jgi:predicted nuclease with RNAse H fold
VPSVSDLCVGIDLAGVEHRETGIAVLRAGRLEALFSVGPDAEVLAAASPAGAEGVVAINAPLTLPNGRCCLDDECGCRHDPGTRSRQIERDLGRMRVPTLATALIKVLARRGIRLAATLRAAGCPPIETYPFATLRLLGLPTAGKRTFLGRCRIHQALQALVPGLDHLDASEHQLDAVVCAYTGRLWLAGLTRTVGTPDEGLMVVPDPDRCAATWGGSVRAAEPRAGYGLASARSE